MFLYFWQQFRPLFMADGNFLTSGTLLPYVQSTNDPNIAVKCQWTVGSLCNCTLIIYVFFTLFLFVFLLAVLKKIQLGNLGCILKLGPGTEKVTNCRQMTHKMSNLCRGNQEYTVLIFSPMPEQWILYTVDIIKPIYVYNLPLRNTKHSF
jgi:hypothetical protein